jgi:hypothetical protein
MEELVPYLVQNKNDEIFQNDQDINLEQKNKQND